MDRFSSNNRSQLLTAAASCAAFVFLYWSVLTKLGLDWWMDENYSHGLLVPFVIGFILWREWDDLKAGIEDGTVEFGLAICALALILLVAGMLGSELFTTRISMVLMLAGILVYLFGPRIVRVLAVPFALLLLAIPIPQIIFNKIAFPLQIWASKMAVWGIRLFEIPTVRSGNVIDILPVGSTQTVSLEVVEACSGIRSLMTLVTLALVLAYFTRLKRGPADLLRAVLLMASAIPIAVMTNAARVTTSGVLTYYYGKPATEGTWHEVSGWLVYTVALVLLLAVNHGFVRMSGSSNYAEAKRIPIWTRYAMPPVLPLIAMLVIGGLVIHWVDNRGEAAVPHTPLNQLPSKLGDWQQVGGNILFDEQVTDILRATDYVMREYAGPDGRMANLYVGYYASQRTGASYHSPQNCLPGAGWVLKDPKRITLTTTDGQSFEANQYVVENGMYSEVMIYWYQGRGHTEASEYRDKLNTVWDSITRSRSDGAMVRVMTNVGQDKAAAEIAAADLAVRLSEALPAYVPD
jgi:exosortase D (VPLPA-CTERM-specific)